MPLVRKLVNLRSCKAVVIPKEWLEWLQREHGSEINEVLIEVNNELRIQPVLPQRRESDKV